MAVLSARWADLHCFFCPAGSNAGVVPGRDYVGLGHGRLSNIVRLLLLLYRSRTRWADRPRCHRLRGGRAGAYHGSETCAQPPEGLRFWYEQFDRLDQRTGQTPSANAIEQLLIKYARYLHDSCAKHFRQPLRVLATKVVRNKPSRVSTASIGRVFGKRMHSEILETKHLEEVAEVLQLDGNTSRSVSTAAKTRIFLKWSFRTNVRWLCLWGRALAPVQKRSRAGADAPPEHGPIVRSRRGTVHAGPFLCSTYYTSMRSYPYSTSRCLPIRARSNLSWCSPFCLRPCAVCFCFAAMLRPSHAHKRMLSH